MYERGMDMYEIGFILIAIAVVGNLIMLVKNFKGEKKAVDEKMKENGGAGANNYVKNTASKGNTNNKTTTNKKKNYSYRK